LTTIKQSLKEQYYNDVDLQKNYTIKNQLGFEMKYSTQRECFIGVAQYCKNCSKIKESHPEFCKVTNPKKIGKLKFEKGIEQEFMAEINTMVPIYWIQCSNTIKNNETGKERICGEHELVGIWEEGDTFDCRKCKFTNQIKLVLDPKSEQYKLLQKIKGE